MRDSEYLNMYRAEDRHWWYVALHKLILDCIPRNRQGLRILDAGCGTGRLLELLQEYGTAEGVDASDIAVSLCRQRGLTRVRRADLNTDELGTAEYDLITSIDVLYHRDVRDDRAVLGKMHRALKPGGRLVLQVPAYEWLRSSHDDAVLTARRYTLRQVKSMMQACGFSLDKTTFRVSLLFIPIAAARLVRKITRGGADAASDVRKYPAVVNAALSLVMKLENRLLKHCSFPFGASVFVAGIKTSGFPGEAVTGGS